MEPQRPIEFCELSRRDSPDPAPQPLSCNGSDLFGVRLGIHGETARRR